MYFLLCNAPGGSYENGEEKPSHNRPTFYASVAAQEKFVLSFGTRRMWRGVSLIWNMNFDFPATTHAIKAALIPFAARTDGIIWRLERFGGEEMVRVLATR